MVQVAINTSLEYNTLAMYFFAGRFHQPHQVPWYSAGAALGRAPSTSHCTSRAPASIEAGALSSDGSLSPLLFSLPPPPRSRDRLPTGQGAGRDPGRTARLCGSDRLGGTVPHMGLSPGHAGHIVIQAGDDRQPLEPRRTVRFGCSELA